MKKPVCKSCFADIQDKSLITWLSPKPILCDRCLGSERRLMRFSTQGKHKIYSLFEYASPVKDWLFRYKTLNDFEMRSVFLYPFGWTLRLLAKKWVFALVPTTGQAYRDRGFDHLEEMLGYVGIKAVKPFAKDDGPSQKNLAYGERMKVWKRISLRGPAPLAGKKVLVFDDVMTTGATIEACLDLALEGGAKSATGIVLMENLGMNIHSHISNL